MFEKSESESSMRENTTLYSTENSRQSGAKKKAHNMLIKKDYGGTSDLDLHACVHTLHKSKSICQYFD